MSDASYAIDRLTTALVFESSEWRKLVEKALVLFSEDVALNRVKVFGGTPPPRTDQEVQSG